MATKEHLVPVSAGGKVLGFSNVVIACFRCNQQRGGLLSATDKFAKYLEAIKLSDLLEQVLELKEETWH